ncbi:DUF1206 domain-containing protein [Glaciecola sp. 1036]|uniref:DUF1206 domain-containing protein n=1 Tax=Alteromonadaceae TaxID=72275 RepID=UPI003D08B0EE
MNTQTPISYFAKIGYSARGVIYLIIGSLALMIALGLGGKQTNAKGAISTLLEQPFGWFFLILFIVGLFSYSGWRFYQAIFDPDEHGYSVKGLMVRLGLFGSMISHALLGYWASKLAIGLKSAEDKNVSVANWLGEDYAVAILGVFSLVTAIIGVSHLVKALKAKFDDYMEIPENHRIWILPLCKTGLISRGIAWLILSLLFLQSALITKDHSIKGMQDVLTAVSEDTLFGDWLLSALALGLVSFGIYSFLEAIYRKIEF